VWRTADFFEDIIVRHAQPSSGSSKVGRLSIRIVSKPVCGGQSATSSSISVVATSAVRVRAVSVSLHQLLEFSVGPDLPIVAPIGILGDGDNSIGLRARLWSAKIIGCGFRPWNLTDFKKPDIGRALKERPRAAWLIHSSRSEEFRVANF
jgi:hypothetical protein